jgi:hypothetical protein
MSKQPESDPFVGEPTVWMVRDLIEDGPSRGTLTEDSPVRVQLQDSYITFTALTLGTKDDRGIAEPIDEDESAALETYRRCNVNHLVLYGHVDCFDDQHMYRQIDAMHDRADSIPELALKMPVAA